MIIPRVGSRDEFPLAFASCHYHVVDIQAFVALEQLYVSNAKTPQHITYALPLPTGTTVCSFKAVFDGQKVVQGRVTERRLAKSEAGTPKSKTVTLLETHHSDTFQVSLGSVLPNQVVAIYVSLVTSVCQSGALLDSTRIRLIIPTTIAPRVGVPPSISAPAWTSFVGKSRLQISVSIQAAEPISSISSPSHSISTSHARNAPRPANPTFGNAILKDTVLLGKDVIIDIHSQKLDTSRCFVEYDPVGQTTAYALTLIPRFNLPALTHQEYIFLIDCSSSMAGTRMTTVRYALQVMLRSLPAPNTVFNLIFFGTEFKPLWRESMIYSSDTLIFASEAVDRMQAKYKGSETNKALRAALGMLTRQAVNGRPYPSTIFLLTDGNAWDVPNVVDTVRQGMERAQVAKRTLRIMVLGIGDEVTLPMCDAISSVGQGISMLVSNVDESVPKLVRLVAAARSTRVDDLVIEWDGSDHSKTVNGAVPPQEDVVRLAGGKTITLPPIPQFQQAPADHSLPIPLYPGFLCSVFAIVKSRQFTPNSIRPVRLKGTVAGQPFTFDIKTEQVKPLKTWLGESAPIHTVAARAMINLLEESSRSDKRDAQIIRWAKRYSLVSSQTSFVAVPDVAGNHTHTSPRQTQASTSGSGSIATVNGQPKSDAARGVPSARARTVKSHPPSAPRTPSSLMILSRPPSPPITLVAVSSESPDSPLQLTGYTHSQPESLVYLSDPTSPSSSYIMLLTRSQSPPTPVLILGGDEPETDDEEEEEDAEDIEEFHDEVIFEQLMPRREPVEDDDNQSLDSFVTATMSKTSLEPIVRMQGFDGSFRPSQELWSILFDTADIAQAKLSRPSGLSSMRSSDEVRKTTVWCTLLALAFLDRRCPTPEERESWSLVAEKAIAFVERFLSEAKVDKKSIDILIRQWQLEAKATSS